MHGRAHACLAARPPVHISPIGSDIPHCAQSEGAPSHTDSQSSALASNAQAGRDSISTPVWSAMVTPATQGHAVGEGVAPRGGPHPERLALWAWPMSHLNTVGLPQSVITTIQSTRASSTRPVYDYRWKIFEDWCHKEGHQSSWCEFVILTGLY